MLPLQLINKWDSRYVNVARLISKIAVYHSFRSLLPMRVSLHSLRKITKYFSCPFLVIYKCIQYEQRCPIKLLLLYMNVSRSFFTLTPSATSYIVFCSNSFVYKLILNEEEGKQKRPLFFSQPLLLCAFCVLPMWLTGSQYKANIYFKIKENGYIACSSYPLLSLRKLKTCSFGFKEGLNIHCYEIICVEFMSGQRGVVSVVSLIDLLVCSWLSSKFLMHEFFCFFLLTTAQA